MAYSSSYISKFAKCPLAAHYSYDLNLRPRLEQGHHLVYGSACHKATSVGYGKGTQDEIEAAFLAHYPVQLDLNDLAKTRDNGVAMLKAYATHYSGDLDRWEVLENEVKQAGEDEFVVKLDLVVRDRECDQILGVDHKFTGKYLNYDYWAGFEPNSQVSEYVRYIKEKYGRCDGFIINAISMRWLSEKDKSGRFNGKYFEVGDVEALKYSERVQRYSKYYKKDMLACWGLQLQFERQTFNRTEEQLEQDYESRLYWVNRIEEAQAGGVWGMNTGSCKFCEYREVCKNGWQWPMDQDVITLEYMQVCHKHVDVVCWDCGGKSMGSPPCGSCFGTGRVPGDEYCNQEVGHGGECAYVLPEQEGEFNPVVEVSGI